MRRGKRWDSTHRGSAAERRGKRGVQRTSSANPGPGATQEHYYNVGIPSKSFSVVAVTVSW